MKNYVSVTFMVMSVVFCTCLITANLFGTKIIAIGPFTTTAALLVFPISYIVNDCVTEIWGYRHARLMITLAFLINLTFIALSTIAVANPAAPYWTGEAAFNFVFSLTPRIAIASLLAFLFGSLINARVMAKMKAHSPNQHFSLRAVVSTVVGESIDSLIFYPIAFTGLLPVSQLISLMIFQVVMKTLYEIVALPVTMNVVKRIEKHERDFDTLPSSSLERMTP
ncbi:MAG: queuosine precursor transporter [Burkholderiaceae bacterium]|nr:queuosine precursor transporter [Burkholderiaceae bacterium]